MGYVDVISNLMFLAIGLFGISTQFLKEINFLVLLGSFGIIAVVIFQFKDYKNQKSNPK